MQLSSIVKILQKSIDFESRLWIGYQLSSF